MSLSPATANLTAGQTLQFAATVTGTANAATWSLSPVVGTISSSGLYTSPSGVSSTQTVTVTATVNGMASSATIRLSPMVIGSQPPSLVSLSPFQGSGPSATLTMVYAHPSGWPAIQSAEVIINPRWEPGTRGGGCYIKYAPGTGLFTLIGDDGSSIAGTAAPGSASVISNSQCMLNGASSSVAGSGNNLTVVASLTFTPNFGGQRPIWMQAVDYHNATTNWLVYGVWFPTQTTVTAGPWYRVYDPNSKSYLYTADSNEYNTLGAEGFVQQGTAGLVMNGSATVGGISNIAWYRVYVNASNSHFWTSDRNEYLTLINSQGAYVGEGVAAFVMPYINAQGQVSPQVTNTIPFYRAAFQGANLHFWTSDSNEYAGTNGEHLPGGYVGEGIACYIFPAAGAKLSSEPLSPALAEMDDGSPAVVSVVNGASYVRSGVIAPGQVLTVYGRHLGERVLLNGVPAQVLGATESAVRVVVPTDLGGASQVVVEVERQGRRTAPVTLSVAQADPAIFAATPYGRGNAQARNADGAVNGPEHPAARGSLVTLYTTGFPVGNPPIEAHIAGQPADIVSTQVSAIRAGTMEVQIRVPNTVDPAPFQPVVLHVGNLFSQPGVGLAIQ